VRVLVLGTNYFPEKTAVAPFASGLCEHLAAKGHEVTMVTAFPYYPECGMDIAGTYLRESASTTSAFAESGTSCPAARAICCNVLRTIFLSH